MRGDPTPLCVRCGEYLPGLHTQLPDGRLSCLTCWSLLDPKLKQPAPTQAEWDAAIASIKEAIHGTH